MNTNGLTKDLVTILHLIKEINALTCAGACERKRGDEIHCRDVTARVNMSGYSVRDKIQTLIRMGLMESYRVERELGGFVTKFVLTPDGEKALASQGNLG